MRRSGGATESAIGEHADLGELDDLTTPWRVHVVATLRIVHHLAADATDADDLAAAAKCDADSPGRVTPRRCRRTVRSVRGHTRCLTGDMAEQPILVLGATGSTGRRVTNLLRAKGVPVRPASRRGDVPFDWTDPTTWGPTVAGVSRMYLMAPHELPVDPAFVACAVEQGVRHVVLLSSGGIEVMGDERLLAAERTVRSSGADWTIVRPSWFNQNFDEGFFREAVVAGELALPVGDLRQGFVDADDIAAVAVAALTSQGHAGQSYELTGPRALTFTEALSIIGRAAGREVRFLGGVEDYLAAQEAFGVPAEQVKLAVESFEALRRDGDQRPTDVVRQVTGREPKDFEEYAAEAAARGAWRG